MSHIVSILKAPNGIMVKLLGEKHAKSKIEEQKCNIHIKDQKVTDILLENAKISKFSKFFLNMVRKFIRFDVTTSSIVYAQNYNTRCNTLEKNQSDVICNETMVNNVKFHDLEKNNLMYIGDELFALTLIPMLGLSPFTKRYPCIKSHIFVPFLGYQLINLLFPFVVTPLSYTTKSKLSRWMVCDTLLYRRDKIMADSIIEHTKLKVQKDNSLSLCIFGAAHHEGICYYLQKNGFIFIEKPVKF